MNKYLFEALVNARNSRRERHIAPEYIPVNELSVSGIDEANLRDELNIAYREGYIKVHRGINQKLIQLLKDEYDE